MFFNFKYWHFLTNPQFLAEQLKKNAMRGFNARVYAVFLIGLVLFMARELWGMNTETLTPLLTTMSTVDYTLARYASLLGIVVWALLYMFFHYFGFAYILYLITKIPFKKLLPVQLLVTSLFIMEKALVFFVFTLTGTTASVSYLSFGPLAATFIEIPFYTSFFNQLSVFTAVVIGIQYQFIVSYNAFDPKKILWILIGLHLVLALMVASTGFIPTENLFQSIFERGAGNE
ncbi:hypothetical protein ACFSFY_14965 [Sporosarcina siberiensis]|uniref:Yip1 domain-containing protein n=1 Tax=Sporosarcina siberiensis TaxID=1365606 RepID=A0ABW4SIT4_9BACL